MLSSAENMPSIGIVRSGKPARRSCILRFGPATPARALFVLTVSPTGHRQARYFRPSRREPPTSHVHVVVTGGPTGHVLSSGRRLRSGSLPGDAPLPLLASYRSSFWPPTDLAIPARSFRSGRSPAALSRCRSRGVRPRPGPSRGSIASRRSASARSRPIVCCRAG
jgi:hypothetical protein